MFCAIAAGEAPASIVWEDTLAIAFMDLRQPNPGHTLVIPRAHIADILGPDEQTSASLMAGGATASTSGSRQARQRGRRSSTCTCT